MREIPVLFTLLTLPTLTLAEAAHQHGVADLNIAWSAQEVVLELHSPADNILGFEHSPRTDAQQQQLATSLSQLKQADALFSFPKATQCVLKTVEIENPFTAESEPETHHDDEMHLEEHDEIHFGEQHHEEHDDDVHSDMSATYLYQCQQSLTDLNVQGLFMHFPRLKTLRVQWVSDQGQSATELTQENTLVDFAR